MKRGEYRKNGRRETEKKEHTGKNREDGLFWYKENKAADVEVRKGKEKIIRGK